ncbi:MAG: ribosome-associated translation inhibitor RaiA [Anaerolineae bacterium]|nr:ribosome-associated translation inhibitor RaiA [Anaerolineae bacterium]
MDVKIHGKQIDITPEFEAYTQDKLSKLNRYLPNIRSIEVEMREEHSNRGRPVISAQITLRHERGAILRTEERSEKDDYNTAKAVLLAASDKMYRRIRRFKGKRRSKRMREVYTATQDEIALAEPLPGDAELNGGASPLDDFNVYEDGEFEIVRRKRVLANAMNEDEAIEQMELLGHSFFLFFNPESNSVNVVYKRTNGGYGLLIPDVV